VGYLATASTYGAVCIGYNTSTAGQGVSVGFNIVASGADTVLVGSSASANAAAYDGVGIGRAVSITNNSCVVIGRNSSSSGIRGTVIGYGSTVTASNSVAIGAGVTVSQASSVGVGRNITISSQSGLALGEGSGIGASSNNAISLGLDSDVATSLWGIAIGYTAEISGANYGMALGANAGCTHTKSVSIGYNAVTTAASRITFGTIGGSDDLEGQFGAGIAVWGGTPPATQPAKISDPTGGAVIDSEARTAINGLIDALEAYGIMADT